MNYLGVTFAFLLTVAISTATGQTTDQPATLPSGPLIARTAPDFSQWVETTVIKPDDTPGSSTGTPTPPSKPPPPQIVRIVKTGAVRHMTFISGTDVTGETWCKGTSQIITHPEWKEPVLSTGTNHYDAARIDFSHGDFTGFDWISAQTFSTMRKVGGRTCMVFKSSVADNPYSPAEKADVEAVVDLETRLPVSLQKGKSNSTYVFGAPPTEILTLPSNLQSVLDKWSQVGAPGTPPRP